MALSDDERATLLRLNNRHRKSLTGYVDSDRGMKFHGFRSLDRYFYGQQHLEQLGLAVPDDLRQFVTIVAWPGTYVSAIAERCSLQGFDLPGATEVDAGLATIWEENELDRESILGHLDSLKFGRAYSCVGTGDDPEMPLVTVESAMEMVHEWSARDREVTAAARFYVDETTGSTVRRATLYLPNSTIWCVSGRGGWQEDPEIERDDHGNGLVPVTPLTNGATLDNRYGVSQMVPIIGLTDAAARALTNAQVATEVMALPGRWAAGMTAADFKDPRTGEALTAWESYFGAIMATSNKDAKFGQFSAADLRNFTEIVNHYAHLVSGATGLPMRYFGQNTANPPSAEGILADESRLVKTCDLKMLSWGNDWARTMRIARLFQTGADDRNLARIKAIWANPGTPTKSQQVDAAIKGYGSGLVTKRQSRRDMGYTSTQIANMEQDDLREASDPLVERLLRPTTELSGAAASGG